MCFPMEICPGALVDAVALQSHHMQVFKSDFLLFFCSCTTTTAICPLNRACRSSLTLLTIPNSSLARPLMELNNIDCPV